MAGDAKVLLLSIVGLIVLAVLVAVACALIVAGRADDEAEQTLDWLLP